jgi:hypothetical protein
MRDEVPRRSRNRAWNWLLVVPLVAQLIPPIYNTASPHLIGIPFFYWYLLLWVPLTAAITFVVYDRTRGDR